MTDTTQYAHCLDCPAVFADRAAMSEHGTATLAPTGEQGITAQGHRARVDNPTPEERAESRDRSTVSRAIERAMDAAFDALDSDIRRGDITEDAVTQQLRDYPDFADAWDEWRAEGDR